MCLGSRWRSRSLHSKNVEAVDIWNGGEEDRTGEIKTNTSLSDFLSSQFCYLQFSGPADCKHVCTPLHSISKELLPCMCVCLEGKVCERKGFAQTYCMIKLWLYFFLCRISPICSPICWTQSALIYCCHVEALLHCVNK